MAGLRESRESALPRSASIIRNRCQGVQVFWSTTVYSRYESFCNHGCQYPTPFCFYRKLLDYIPATPQRPNPELRIVDPLLISATTSSAFLNSFEAPRSIFGANRCGSGATVEYRFASPIIVGRNEGRTLVLQRTPN